jgi:hypothetical protein
VFGDSVGFRMALFPYLLGMPFAAHALVKRFGRDRWLALGAFTVVVEANLLWGFAPYVTATVVMFAAIVVAIDALREGRWWRYVLHGALGVIVFFSHPEVCGIWSATCGFIALVAWLSRRAPFSRATWLVVSILPAFAMLALYMLSAGWVDGSALNKIEFPTSAGTAFMTVRQTLELLPLWSGLALMVDDLPLRSYFIAIGAVAVASGVQWWLRRRSGGVAPASRWTFAVIVMVVLWTLMVFELPAWSRGEPIAVRIPSFVAFALFWLFPFARPRSTAEQRTVIPARVALFACALTTLIFSHQRFHAFDKSVAPLGKIIDNLPRNARVATLIYDTTPVSIVSLPTYVHLGGYVLAARGGMASFNFNVVPYKDAEVKKYALVYQVWAPSTGWTLPLAYADYYDYVLVKKGPNYPGKPFAPSQLAVAERIFAEGDFELWRSLPRAIKDGT